MAWPAAALACLAAAAATAVPAAGPPAGPPAQAGDGGGSGDELALVQLRHDVRSAPRRATAAEACLAKFEACTSDDQCCGPMQCVAAAGSSICEDFLGAVAACAGPGNKCGSDGDCCGAMTCSPVSLTCIGCDPLVPGSCAVFADPHVSGFDALGRGVPDYLAMITANVSAKRPVGLALVATGAGAMRPVGVNAYETGDFWIVKARDVQVQGRLVRSGEFVPDRAALGAVAVAGPMLGGRRLLLEPMNGHVAWDGQRLSPVRLDANLTAGPVQLSSGPGPQPGTSRVEARLPGGVQLLAIRFARYLDLRLTVPLALGHRDGLCGNSNGIEEDDTEEGIKTRMGSLSVAPHELLFKGNDMA